MALAMLLSCDSLSTTIATCCTKDTELRRNSCVRRPEGRKMRPHKKTEQGPIKKHFMLQDTRTLEFTTTFDNLGCKSRESGLATFIRANSVKNAGGISTHQLYGENITLIHGRPWSMTLSVPTHVCFQGVPRHFVACPSIFSAVFARGPSAGWVHRLGWLERSLSSPFPSPSLQFINH